MELSPKPIKMASFRSPTVKDLIDSIGGSLAQLSNSFKEVQASQRKLPVYNEGVHGGAGANKLHVVCPVSGELVLAIDADVERLINYDLPQAFEKLQASHLAPGDTSCDEVSIYNFEGCGGLLLHLKYCNLHPTGELTNHNSHSQFQKSVDGKINRVLTALGAPDLAEAPHWPKNDLASAKLLSQWMETSMMLFQLQHYIIYSLHMERFLARDNMVPFSKGSCSAQIKEKLEDQFKSSPGYKEHYGGKKKKWKADSPDCMNHVAQFVEKEFEAVLVALATTEAKTRAISTPYSVSKSTMEPQVSLKDPVHFNRAEGRKPEEMADAWQAVWQFYMLQYHKSQQFRPAEEGTYPLKGRPFDKETYNAIQDMQKDNPGEFNPAAWEAIHHPKLGAIAKSVIPPANNTIRLLDRSGKELQSPKGGCLTPFEACIAYGELSGSKYKRNMGDDAIVLVSCSISERAKSANRVSVCYGTPHSIQLVLPAAFVHDVLNAEYGSWHKTKAGQPTPPPALVNPFNDVKKMITNYTRIGGNASERATNRAFEKRHDAFETYDEPTDVEAYESPTKRAKIEAPEKPSESASPSNSDDF